MLGKNGLGPANPDYVASLGDDQFAKALDRVGLELQADPRRSRLGCRRGLGLLEEFFGKISAVATSTPWPPSTTPRSPPMLNAQVAPCSLAGVRTRPGHALSAAPPTSASRRHERP